MILYDNGLPLAVIGYIESSLTQEVVYLFKEEWPRFNQVGIITPDDFYSLTAIQRKRCQYAVAFNKDQVERTGILNMLEIEKLNCPTGIHSKAFVADPVTIGHGVMVAPFAALYANCTIGDYTIIDSYAMVSHYTSIGDHCHLRPGAIIAGKTTVGDHCNFGLRSTVADGIAVCDNVNLGGMSGISKNIEKPGTYVGTPARRVGD
jgi:UDP-3-O-[3-hydroxymyristoyl] glucosamine N-acyltransferase